MPDQEQLPACGTDEEALRRLQLVENAISDMLGRLPGIARDLEWIGERIRRQPDGLEAGR